MPELTWLVMAVIGHGLCASVREQGWSPDAPARAVDLALGFEAEQWSDYHGGVYVAGYRLAVDGVQRRVQGELEEELRLAFEAGLRGLLVMAVP